MYSETFYPRYHFGWSELLAATDDRYRYIHAPRPSCTTRAAIRPSARPRFAARATLSARDGGLAGDGGRAREAAHTAGRRPPTVAENLRALGYVGGGPARLPPAAPLPDPKDKIGVYEAYRRAGASAAGVGTRKRCGSCERVLADTPGMVDAWHLLGLTLFRMGRQSEAMAALGPGGRRSTRPTRGRTSPSRA